MSRDCCVLQYAVVCHAVMQTRCLLPYCFWLVLLAQLQAETMCYCLGMFDEHAEQHRVVWQYLRKAQTTADPKTCLIRHTTARIEHEDV